MFNAPKVFSITEVYSPGRRTLPEHNSETLSHLEEGHSSLSEALPDSWSHLHGRQGYAQSTRIMASKKLFGNAAASKGRGGRGRNTCEAHNNDKELNTQIESDLRMAPSATPYHHTHLASETTVYHR